MIAHLFHEFGDKQMNISFLILLFIKIRVKLT